MNFTITEDGWVSQDGTYLLRRETNPWSNRPDDVTGWTVRVKMYGEVWSRIATSGSLLEAQRYAEADAELPVFGDDSLCKWCRADENYLAEVPRGWFGCRLCDPARKDREDDLSWEDLEAFDDPA